MTAREAPEAGLGSDEEFDALLDFIKEQRGFDFTGYKKPSLKRRIARRMQTAKINSYVDYLERLRSEDGEYAALFDTILINVTSFFRDPPAWEALGEEVIPQILADHEDASAIRFWSAGCATGEEAYTLGILLAEAMGAEDYAKRVKLYATDADEAALTEGRHARYKPDQIETVPAVYRERYFDEVDGRYALRPEIRRSVIFGRNDLVSDAPISRVALIVARNTLMYFDPDTQRRILGNFHFALGANGVLFLGKSEVFLTRTDYFAPIDLKRRIFRKVERTDFGESLRRVAKDQLPQRERPLDDVRIPSASFEAAPVAQLVIDRGGVLASANAHARAMFGLSTKDLGRPFQDLEVSYRPLDLRSLMDQVHVQHHPAAVRDVEWQMGGDLRSLDVHVAILHSADGAEVGTSISFMDTTRFRRLQDSLEQSKERLETAYEELQSTAEELETTNEELQSTNEELETTNEELQSTNEELETMNEELQSTNEELHTINDELRDRTDDLHGVNSFLEAILGSLGSGVAVTDHELRIQAWNEQARDLWGVTPDDVRGQHLLNLDIGLPLDETLPIVRSALAGEDGDLTQTLEATNRRGRSILCRVRTAPLRTPTGEVSGVIVLMDDLGSRDGG